VLEETRQTCKKKTLCQKILAAYFRICNSDENIFNYIQAFLYFSNSIQKVIKPMKGGRSVGTVKPARNFHLNTHHRDLP